MNPDNYRIVMGGILYFEVECNDDSTPDLGLEGITGMDSKCWMDMGVKMERKLYQPISLTNICVVYGKIT